MLLSSLIIVFAIELIIKLDNKYKPRDNRLEKLFGKIGGNGVENFVTFVVILVSVASFIANNVFLIEFLEHLFCDLKIADLCFTKNMYYLFIFLFCVLIAFFPDLERFSLVSIFSFFIFGITCEFISTYTYSRGIGSDNRV